MRMEIPFVGGHAQVGSPETRNLLCENLYAEIEKPGSKTAVSLLKVPGYTLFAEAPTAPCRSGGARFDRENVTVNVIGSRVYTLTTDGTLTDVGGVASSNGRVSIVQGRTQVLIADGTPNKLYVYAGGVVTPVVTTFTATHVAWVGSYFVAFEEGVDQFHLSLNDDGTVWPGTEWATAESRPDAGVTLASMGGYLVLMGEETVEIYAHSGENIFPFSSVPGGVMNYGVSAPWSVARTASSAYWLAKSDRGGAIVIEAMLSGQARPISDRYIEREFRTFAVTNDAEGFVYEQDGHVFYQLTFPTEGKTFAYDATTEEWATRTTAGLTRDLATGHVYSGGLHLMSDYASGKIYRLDPTNYDRSWRRRFQIINYHNRMLHYNRFELNYERGTALAAGPGSDPLVWLRQSNDGGRRFGNESYRKTGLIGETTMRAVWSGACLTSSRDKVFEIGSNEPIKTVILGAYVDVEKGT